MKMPSPLTTLALSVLLLLLTACQSASSKLQRATVETGPRFERDGTFTDQPSLTVPIWESRQPAHPEPVRIARP